MGGVSDITLMSAMVSHTPSLEVCEVIYFDSN